jgi:polysaccharide biosynthesis transport protein
MSIPPQQSGGTPVEKRWEPELLLWIGWQRKGWVLLGILAGIAVGAAIASALPRTYQSSAVISVVKKRPDAVTGWDTRQLSTEGQISPPQDLLKSSLILDRAIRSKDLGTLSNFANETQDLTESIRNSLTVVPTRGATGQTLVFKLHYRGRVPEDCSLVLASVLDSYKEYMDRKHQSVSEDTVELILRDKQNLEKAMSDKEKAYSDFRATAPLLGKGKDGLELRQEKMNTIQARLSTLLVQRIDVEGQLAALEAARKDGRSTEAILTMLTEFARKADTGEGGRDRTANVQEQLFPLLMEERKLIELHGPKHPELIAVQNRIEAARRLLVLPPTAWKGKNDDGNALTMEDAIVLHTQLLKQKLTHLKATEALLTHVILSEQDEARRLASYEIQNDSFRTSIAMHQQLYEALVKRLNEVSLTRDAGGYLIELIEPPSAAKRVAPSTSLSLLIGAFAGLLLGLTMAYGADRRDQRFRATTDVSRVLGVPVLGTVPSSSRNAMSVTDQTGSFWRLRNVLSLLAEKSGPKVIQVAGSAAGVGATTVAASLGASLAQTGKKVLIIDANLGSPAIGRLLGQPEAAGLSAYLAGHTTLEAIVRESGVTGLALIGASTGEIEFKDPAHSPRFAEMVATLKAHFDFVIIDSPPLLTSPDASALARHVDAAVLTIDFTRSTRPEAERAAQLLASTGVKTLGVILNRAKA